MNITTNKIKAMAQVKLNNKNPVGVLIKNNSNKGSEKSIVKPRQVVNKDLIQPLSPHHFVLTTISRMIKYVSAQLNYQKFGSVSQQ